MTPRRTHCIGRGFRPPRRRPAPQCPRPSSRLCTSRDCRFTCQVFRVADPDPGEHLSPASESSPSGRACCRREAREHRQVRDVVGGPRRVAAAPAAIVCLLRAGRRRACACLRHGDPEPPVRSSSPGMPSPPNSAARTLVNWSTPAFAAKALAWSRRDERVRRRDDDRRTWLDQDADGPCASF